MSMAPPADDFKKVATGGGHHIFYRAGVEEILNLQAKGGKCKPYQVKQVRSVILKYRLAGETDA